ncbi:MAG: cytochrome d ubiquinol oxidase subunit II [Ignavibacteriaceae bacterium]
MIYVIIFFLLVSVYLYCLLGGADFGAGIVELFSFKGSKEKTRKLVTQAMAPIWEANHMWLIITIVILFNAFPPIYSRISISLYIPLILLLLGIVFRGTAFTFRHYDAIKDQASQNIYSRVFEYSSVFVTFFFGLTVGAVVSGKMMINPTGFVEAYIHPWLNLFSISIGLFLCSLFAFLASVFLIGDSTDEDIIKTFIAKSKKANIATIISGGLVFITSYTEGIGFTEDFFAHPVSILLIILATASLPVLWNTISKGSKWKSRFIAGAQLLFILGAFYAVYFPTIVKLKDSENLTLYNSSAPEITLAYLGWALIIGSFIIFPSLYYLLKVFKIEKQEAK